MSLGLNSSQDDVKSLEPNFKKVYIFISLISFIIFSRLWYLQIIKGTELRDFSNRNRLKENNIEAPRGLILDRKEKVLVDNLFGFNAIIVPQDVKDLKLIIKDITPILELEDVNIEKMFKEHIRKNGYFRPMVLKSLLTMEEVVRVKRIKIYHPGLDIKETIIRHYPINDNGAQLFGYVSEISKKQIKKLNKKYRGQHTFEQGDIIGKSGLEQYWESYIRGQKGISFAEVDARGRKSLLGFDPLPSKAGHNLVLTIDKDIQEAAFKAMNRDDKIGPRIGALVALKSNGEILAWVNSPSYDPNEFSRRISSKIWNELINDPFKPLRNKVIQDHYPPGSTFKPLVALAALQEDIIERDTVIHAPGLIYFGRRPYHDHNKSGHGNITVLQAIERSSNVFFYKMGIQLGIDKMAGYISNFGIGQKTNINFFNEVPGLMPTKEWKLKRFGEPWQPGENLSNAIGQGFVLTTPLQMALAYNAIGLNGKLYKPILVKRIIDSENNIVKNFDPILVRDISDPELNFHIDKENFETVKEGMRLVANGDRGTAKWWQIPGVQIAGKTGTAQIQGYSADEIYDKCEKKPFEQRHHGWFVGFAPFEKPLITVAILAQHSCHGSTGGAPIVRDVIKAYLEKYHPELLTINKKKVTLKQ